jgi:N-acetyl-gamma-glutamyl-phosphate reductase
MKAGIIGGTGYTGRELIRLLRLHPKIQNVAVYGRNPGRLISEEFPELRGLYDAAVLPLEPEKIVQEVDVVFMALPHQVSMEISKPFQKKVLLIDLSADYRLKDANAYEKWYGIPHKDKEALAHYVYGMPELFRKEIKTARCIASPGCYPTSIVLAVAPLLGKKLLKNASIIADSKSGHSGAGKKLSEMLHAGSVSENVQAYKVTTHQHIGEIEQTLTQMNAGEKVFLTFTPQVVPFDRGILSCVYVDLVESLTQENLMELYMDHYGKEPFIRLYKNARYPTPKFVAHTNFCDIAPIMDTRVNRVTILSCIDNLIKGAGGQAIQAMNIAMGFNESEGLNG